MRSLELFAGAGGLGLGLAQAGIKPTLIVERDRWCCDTLASNLKLFVPISGSQALVRSDIRDICFKAHNQQVDIVSGGPPCQPFSLGGKHGSYDDARDMFPQAVRTVAEAAPRAFIFENVKGLTRSAFIDYFNYIVNQLRFPDFKQRPEEGWEGHAWRLSNFACNGRSSSLQYDVYAKVLNAADYGVPQRRERVFFVGFRRDLGVNWAFPAATHSEDALLLAKRTGRYWEENGVAKRDRETPPARGTGAKKRHEEGGLLPWNTVRQAIATLPDPELTGSEAGVVGHRFQPGARSYPGHTGSPLDEPAKAIKAGVHGVPGGENMLRKPNGSVRYFTVREAARLQTFPDEIVFSGAWSEAMRQIGNAVPVKLANVVGAAVVKALEQVEP